MPNGVILYQSKYGATKKYADWLAEETGFDCVETKKASPPVIAGYETIVLGGGIYASGIAGISFLRKNIELFRGKKLAVFCVGASPDDEKAFQEIYARNFKEALSEIPCFYCRGAWDQQAMSWKDRTLCKMLQKAVEKKDPSAFEPWEAALMSAVGETFDWTDKAYLSPLLAYVNR